MITDQDAVEMQPVLEAIRDPAAGRKRLQDLTLRTSENLACAWLASCRYRLAAPRLFPLKNAPLR
jgi:hypothetical protein